MAAVILEEGSPTMHLAVVARAFDIPVIGQVKGALSHLGEGELAIVDGGEGRVTVRPAEEHRQQLREQESQRAEREALFASIRDLPAETRDGLAVSLNINVGLAVDAEQLERVGAEGIGLCRTEVPFMVAARYPDVDAQTKLYASLIEQAGGRPVVFRTLDVGGDKRLPYLESTHEENPALGWRALRIGLDQPAILRQQLRALLRASADGDLRVMFPMVATVDEFRRARDMLEHERDAALAAAETLPRNVHVGAMLEVPALLWQLPELLAQVDFLSVGTNDLVQFLFASDRGNAKISKRYGILTPAVITLMRNLVQACEDAGVPLAVCGEAAGQPLEAMALIGLGVRNLSMAPRRLGPVKLMCRSLAAAPLGGYLDTLCDTAKASLRDDLLAFAKDHGVEIV
jgi:phosphotransferase system enzyme I (PtsP)